MDIEFIGTLENESAYRAHAAISQSDLKNLLESPKLFWESKFGDHQKFSSGFKMGNALDRLVTMPDEFDRLYIVKPDTIPVLNSKESLMADAMREGMSDRDAYGMGYSTNGNIDAKVKEKAAKIRELLEWEEKSQSNIVLTSKDHDTLTSCYNSIQQHPLASKLLHPKLGESKKSKVRDQLPILFKVNGVSCKALIDRAVLQKKRAWLIDLKTTGKTLHEFWRWDYRKYGYDFQAMFYRWALKAYMDHLGADMPIQTVCIVVETDRFHETSVRPISDDTLARAEADIIEALDIYNLHIKQDQWEYPALEVAANFMLPF